MDKIAAARKTSWTDDLNPTIQLQRLVANIGQAFIGKEEVVSNAILAMISGGHVLLEDVLGVGKTLLAKAIARSVSAEFKRVQFTADLLPSDVTGVTVFSQQENAFSFRRGPVFTNILLADEINRAMPCTQSSLLEAMEEQHVTVDGVRHLLPSPFLVIATQNPVELEGTYPLPFAQMDRFMVRLSIGYLEKDSEIAMLKSQQKLDSLSRVESMMDCDTLEAVKRAVREISVSEELLAYMVEIVRTTRVAEALEHGASPRGTLDLQRFSQAIALMSGRDYVLPDDVKRAARLVLPHRLIVKRGTRSISLNARGVIDHIVDSVPVPV